MRSSKSRSRNKSNRQRSLGNIVNRVFDSSGPEGKVRGTPQQIIEKYLTLARDAQLSHDRVAEQSFFQHAEHYTRMLSEAQREMADRQQQYQQNQNPNQRQNADDDRDNGGRDHGNRDNGNRDGGNRDGGSRDHGNRDHGGRENGHRDNAGRDSGNRDQGQRDQSQRDFGRDNNSSRDDNAPSRNGRDQADGDVKASAAPASTQETDQPREAAAQTEQTPAVAEKPAPARRGRPRRDSSAEKADQSKPTSSHESAEQPKLGLPDAVGSEDENGGLVETPEGGTVKKARAPRTTTRSRATPTDKPKRTTTRRKSADGAKPEDDAPAAPALEPGASDPEKN